MDFYQNLTKNPSQFDRAKNHGEHLSELPTVIRDVEALWRVFKAHSRGVRTPSQTVCDNNNFRDSTVKNKKLGIPILAKAGMHRIADLWQGGEEVPCEELMTKGAPVAEYNLIKKCLARDIPRMTASKWEREHNPVPWYNRTGKLAYTVALKSLREGLVKHPKRRKELAEECNINVEDYTMRYTISMKDQTNTRIKEFFFRDANGLLYGRHDMHKFGLVQSASCPLCGEPDQRWTHKICECGKVKQLKRA